MQRRAIGYRPFVNCIRILAKCSVARTWDVAKNTVELSKFWQVLGRVRNHNGAGCVVPVKVVRESEAAIDVDVIGNKETVCDCVDYL